MAKRRADSAPKKPRSPRIKLKSSVPDGVEQLARADERKPAWLVPVEPNRTPYQELRQARVYDLHLAGWTYREIAKEVGISLDTVVSDMKIEGERLAKAREATIDVKRAKQIARYEARLKRLIAVDCKADENPAEAEAKVALAI